MTDVYKRQRDGSAFWVLDRGKRFYNEEGRQVITSVIIDIDDSVHLQEDMARQSEVLRAKNEELTPVSYTHLWKNCSL